MTTPLIYLAGPVTGGTHAQASAWRNHVKNLLALWDVELLDPMRQAPDGGDAIITAKADAYLSGTGSNARSVRAGNMLDVARCDGVFVNLLGAERVSAGTVYEMGAAAALNKPQFVAIEPDNPHEHLMTTSALDCIYPSIETAVLAVIRAFNLQTKPNGELWKRFMPVGGFALAPGAEAGGQVRETDDRWSGL